ncbi:LysM peptidoglycan-binding domain-containing protein [Fructilactobacillus carniphilus]|uniref:LysM peptidoglycan-binding domain-containing protein n=1 Tax=Fructilactobacillus carniphilus TaxID=2940297 RepID=A0ABY5BYC8_9LACO|nr:LysM peptidoglycan-binding domain-containing protein [Fructilactobacillus carniphilus]USS90378.1 LysM peptidoglycan-binding domain-containing protein [Fructilactobacillus carniphilus]
MKFKGIKTVAAITAVSAGVLFAGANSADASTTVTVKAGDTLSQIAADHDVSVQSLKDANKIQDINKIYVGETFIIGDDGNVQVASTQTPVAPAVQPHYEVKQATAQAETPAQPAAQSQQTSQAAQAETPSQPAAQAQPQQTSQVAAQPAATQTQQTSQAASTQASSNNAADNDGSLDSIAAVESGGSYTARNGQYIGKYQLSASYLNGDYSPANQERVARQYAISRYGSIANAVAFRNSHNYW